VTQEAECSVKKNGKSSFRPLKILGLVLLIGPEIRYRFKSYGAKDSTVNCPGCNINLPKNILLCPSCGYALKSQPPSPNTASSTNTISHTPFQNASHVNLTSSGSTGLGYVGAPAGFWLRTAAYLIDYLLVSFVAFVIGAIYGIAIKESMGLLLITLLLGPWFYEAGMTASISRGTIGKRIVGLQVLTDDGEQLTFGLASGRYWLKVILMLFSVGLITVPAGIRSDRKAGYDILLKTNVYRK
jgi:uncharacterized RDD family membrane protein YckC